MRQGEIDKIQLEDVKRLDRIRTTADDVARSKMVAIQEKAEELKGKIKALVDKKGAIIRAPRCKAETIALAKEALREGRKQWFFEGILLKNLKDFQNQADHFMSEISMKYLLGSDKAWKIAYWIITDKDIENAAGMLPDIGLSVVERDAQMKAIDKEIAELERQIENDFKKL